MKPFRRHQVHSLLRWNSWAFLLVLALILSGPFVGLSPAALVDPPPASHSLYVGFLTHTMQIFCAVPAIACAFSFALLRTLQPEQRGNAFLFGSALVTGGLMANEIFRIHTFLGFVAGTPKWATILGYSTLVLVYGLGFRRRWRSTPYGLLLAAGCLFVVAWAMDSQLLGENVSPLLEGVPKFFSFLNLALYFWLVCRQEVLEHRFRNLSS
jgi:hypothetical protein